MMENRTPKVLILGNFPPPYGGVPEHIEHLLKQIELLGYSCTVISGGNSGSKKLGVHTIHKPTNKQKTLLLLKSIFTSYFFFFLYHYAVRSRDLRSFIRASIYTAFCLNLTKECQYEVVSYYNLYNYGLIAKILADKRNLKLVGNVFGEIYEKPALRQNAEVFAKVLDQSELLLSCSQHCANSIGLLGEFNHMQAHLYGVSIPTSTMKKFTSNTLSVLMVGRHTNDMGAKYYMQIHSEALAKNLPLEFRLYGQAGELSEEIGAYAGTTRNFEMRTNLTRVELDQAYRNADVVVIPTVGDRTCSSLACMDGMMHGCVCIGHAVGGIPELIKDGKTGFLVEIGDITSIMSILSKLCSEMKSGRMISKNAMHFARANFNRDLNHRRIAKEILKYAK